MEISLASADRVRIATGGIEILLSPGSFVIDGLVMDMPGEYEKAGILATVEKFGESLFAHLMVEGRSIAHVGATVSEPDERLSEFLGDIDILFVPGAKDSTKTVEKLESRIVVPYGEVREQFLHSLGQAGEAIKKFKPKDADFEATDVKYVLLDAGE
jgi:hypothetical protein